MPSIVTQCPLRLCARLCSRNALVADMKLGRGGGGECTSSVVLRRHQQVELRRRRVAAEQCHSLAAVPMRDSAWRERYVVGLRWKPGSADEELGAVAAPHHEALVGDRVGMQLVGRAGVRSG